MNTNSAPPEVCQNPQGCQSGGVLPAAQAATVPQGTTYLPSSSPVVVNGVSLQQRPNPYVSYSQSWFGWGTASYHAVNMSVLKRAVRRLTFKANYAFAKVLDLNSAILAPSGENEPPNLFSPFNRHMNKGVAAYSVEHQFNTNFSYQLPFGNGQRCGGGATGWVNHLIGGWQWNGIVSAQSGFPFTPLIGFNNTGSGDGATVDIPNLNPNFKGKVISGSVDHWFDPGAFTVPAPGTFGNAGRSSLRGPGLFNVDTSLFKKIPIREGLNLQFRAEVFNAFNRANFAYPNGIIWQGNSSNYSVSDSAGEITATSTASRQIQLALRLVF